MGRTPISSDTLALLPLPRFAGITNARYLLLGANTPWKCVRLTLGFGTSAANSFKEAFADAGASQFGSGWGWLVFKDGKLETCKTLNAETPVTDALCTPLLTMDVWVHAYYLDYQNRRPDNIAAFLDHLVNWDFANENLERAA